MNKFVLTKNLSELERLRSQLYSVVNGDPALLNSREVCQLSSELDKLIVKYMFLTQGRKTNSSIK